MAGFVDEVRECVIGMPITHKYLWIMEQLGDDAPGFLEVLADPLVPPLAIFRTLEARGYDVSSEAIRGWCRKARK